MTHSKKQQNYSAEKAEAWEERLQRRQKRKPLVRMERWADALGKKFPNETFIQIPEAPNYAVSSSGMCVSLVTANVIAPWNRKGYMWASFSLGKRRSCFGTSVHRLVCRLFNGEGPDGAVVNHLNGKKHDNRACNLQWCTPTENVSHAYRTGLQKSGESHHYRKHITTATALKIRSMSGIMTPKDLAHEMGVCRATIYDIQRGRTWKHILNSQPSQPA